MESPQVQIHGLGDEAWPKYTPSLPHACLPVCGLHVQCHMHHSTPLFRCVRAPLRLHLRTTVLHATPTTAAGPPAAALLSPLSLPGAHLYNQMALPLASSTVPPLITSSSRSMRL
jgi:hypothetical protein